MYTQKEFLSPRELETFQNSIEHNSVPWDLNPMPQESGMVYQVSHTYWDSETGIDPIVNSNTYWQLQNNLIHRIFPTAILRAAIQVALGRETDQFSSNIVTARDHSTYLTGYVFLNTTSGGVELEDGELIASEANTLVIFPGDTPHRIRAAKTEDPVMSVLSFDFVPSVKTPSEFFKG